MMKAKRKKERWRMTSLAAKTESEPMGQEGTDPTAPTGEQEEEEEEGQEGEAESGGGGEGGREGEEEGEDEGEEDGEEDGERPREGSDEWKRMCSPPDGSVECVWGSMNAQIRPQRDEADKEGRAEDD